VGVGHRPAAALPGHRSNRLQINTAYRLVLGTLRNARASTISKSVHCAVEFATTTMNTAFLAGVDNTTPGKYNGGLENYPRFHEAWGGSTLAYRGSFVSLGTPAHVSGNWCETGGSSVSGCNIYNPPLRNWDYDPDFNDVKNIRPLTPRFVSVEQVLFSQDLR